MPQPRRHGLRAARTHRPPCNQTRWRHPFESSLHRRRDIENGALRSFSSWREVGPKSPISSRVRRPLRPMVAPPILISSKRPLGNSRTSWGFPIRRPSLLASVGRQTTHGGAQHLTITSQHAKADTAKSLLARWKVAAKQLKTKSVCQLVL